MSRDPCCTWMQNLAENIGEKGFSLVPVVEGDHRSFKLQAVPLDRDGVEAFRMLRLEDLPRTVLRTANGRPVALAMAMDLPLRFCPSCGANLEDWISRHPAEFAELEESARLSLHY